MCVKPYTLFIRLRKPRVWVEKHDILREMTLFPRNSVFLIVMRSSQTLFLQRKSNILVKSQEYIEVARNSKRCHLTHVFFTFITYQLKCPALPVVFQKPFFLPIAAPRVPQKCSANSVQPFKQLQLTLYIYKYMSEQLYHISRRLYYFTAKTRLVKIYDYNQKNCWVRGVKIISIFVQCTFTPVNVYHAIFRLFPAVCTKHQTLETIFRRFCSFYSACRVTQKR